MERVSEAREALRGRGGPSGRVESGEAGTGAKVSFNDIIIKAVAMALRQHPACNAWWQDDHIRYWNEVHVSMAVAVEEGLITPVIRHADQKTLREIAAESRDLAARARERRLKPEEYTGGTFSVSNLGMLDIDEFTAIINPPEAGILAVGRDRGEAGGARGRRGGAAPDAAHDVLRSPGDRRRDRRPVSQDAEGDAGESAGACLVEVRSET